MTKRSLTTWTIAGLISGWLFAEAVVIRRDAFVERKVHIYDSRGKRLGYTKRDPHTHTIYVFGLDGKRQGTLEKSFGDQWFFRKQEAN